MNEKNVKKRAIRSLNVVIRGMFQIEHDQMTSVLEGVCIRFRFAYVTQGWLGGKSDGRA